MSAARMDFFVAGTDTGVGKTHVTAALLAALRHAGTDAVVMKPVQTGATKDSDLAFCARAAGWRIPERERRDLCPYALALPASPHLAARVAKKTIDPKRLLAALARLQRAHDVVIVEGAGGLLVPLTAEVDQIDFIAATELPVVLVARAGLGTINHTLLSVEALDRRSIPLAGVVLSEYPDAKDAIAAENLRLLQARLGPRPVLAFPRVKSGNFAPAGHELLRGLAGE